MNTTEFLLSEIEKEYCETQRLRENEHGSIIVYTHKQLNKKLIVRNQSGNFGVFEMLKSLKNQNTERIYDVIAGDADRNRKFLVLEEHIGGETLSDILKRRLFDERETMRIVSQLCNALYSIHKLHIVHRDIKPENIMIEKNSGRLKLIDFGAARLHFPNLANDTEIIGTIGFAAPEQFGLVQSDFRTDIYAVGILMNILLTGQHPAVKLYNGRLNRIIEKCIQTVPEKRYKNVIELKKNL